MTQLEPAVGEVWRRLSTATGKLHGLHRLYLVVSGPRVYAPPDKPQVEQVAMLDLERGKLCRFNVKLLHHGNGWAQVTHVRHLNKLCSWDGSLSGEKVR